MMRSDAAFRPPMPATTPPECALRKSRAGKGFKGSDECRVMSDESRSKLITHHSSFRTPLAAGRMLLLAAILVACCLRPARAEITLDALVGFGQSSASTARY